MHVFIVPFAREADADIGLVEMVGADQFDRPVEDLAAEILDRHPYARQGPGAGKVRDNARHSLSMPILNVSLVCPQLDPPINTAAESDSAKSAFPSGLAGLVADMVIVMIASPRRSHPF
ncbi:hypothetical protein [Bosea sp. CRIB-10]|uniref:hypothetical protein n=1 Tax=Bosea sp. CRIB-10 TaxID=378404 RepID=UPI001FCD5F35|nr:hypothetical protein [Bosea sp. CRIB-10]